jgi:DMSO/TMAO reductase YedYZ molybdopterin-dependent catalytic subunit
LSIAPFFEQLFAKTSVSIAQVSGGEKLGILPFRGEGSAAVGKIIDRGLKGRLAFDLRTLSPESLVVPNDKFFIRTRFPTRLIPDKPWTITIHGLVASPVQLEANDLDAHARSMGAYLLECSGNSRRRGFGLLSAAKWSGISVLDVLEKVKIVPKASRVRVSGFDPVSDSALTAKGASWIFSFEELQKAGAFFATKMNGAPLPKDHGYPVRLIIPGWYGCTCIKWVHAIELVDDTAESTIQRFEPGGSITAIICAALIFARYS